MRRWLFALLLLCACARPSPTPDVVLVTIDTLRADALALYSPQGAPTPALEELAAEGVVYEQASSTIGLTLPAHSSILTSLYPRQHGVLSNHAKLPDSLAHLPELLRQHGFRTGAFVGVTILGGAGLERGFDRFSFPERRQRPAHEVVGEALAWVEEQPLAEPLFLWVHLYDPHMPYHAQRGFGPERVKKLPDTIGLTALTDEAQRNGGAIDAQTLAQVLRLYRSEVQYADHWVGRLLAGLREARAGDRSLVIATADHGECFENGFFFEHSDCLYRGTLRVPLIVRYPDGRGAGTRVAAPVGNLDVAPTVLAALGIALPPGFAGRALQNAIGERELLLLAGPPGRLRTAGIRSVGGESVAPIDKVPAQGLQNARWKYLRSGSGELLYPADGSTAEERNVAAENAAEVAALRARFDALLAQHASAPAGETRADPALREKLHALGYAE